MEKTYVKQGKFYKTSDGILFIHHSKDIAFEVKGDSELLSQIIHYCDGTFKVEEILSFITITERDLRAFFNSLVEANALVELTSNIFDGVFILKNNKDVSFLNKEIATTPIEELPSNIKLLIGISYENDWKYFSTISNYAIEHSIPWVKFSIDETFLRLGPYFFPDGGPCFNCLDLRIKTNSENEEKEARNKIPDKDMEKILSSLVIKEVKKYLIGMEPTHLFNTEISINTTTYSSKRVKVLRMPNCTRCNERRKKHEPVAITP
ncbi:hypothetical protein BpOF4_21359 (plasmid) [Alkalihalophilus pseudofirmus OF4]|uniref:Bacteriocin biosynthesis cyclodehydratase domain-containing protein n=1 Tax=Alkalihalophilus pseudofirmus (strain ATCC BAA-2126 / JCM 17055 / OF4) TaxID=398511 RepID=D3G1P1_ALKPO|nr:TOMM precursor leader peptide-binding protein [Alkalihalophilus pseudofirmus]ADC52267.1 hypothetical protein BpOF4_21359 [Alkalihalophilus pseudofirmus OF4]